MALIASLLIAEPAFASVTHTHCQKNACMQLVRNSSSGRTAISAYVYMPGTLTGADVSIRYVGYSAAGNFKGPQKTQSVDCDPICAYKWNINYTLRGRGLDLRGSRHVRHRRGHPRRSRSERRNLTDET